MALISRHTAWNCGPCLSGWISGFRTCSCPVLNTVELWEEVNIGFFFFNGNSASGVDEMWREVLDLWNNCGGYDDYASDFLYWRLQSKITKGTHRDSRPKSLMKAFTFSAPVLFSYTFHKEKSLAALLLSTEYILSHINHKCLLSPCVFSHCFGIHSF